MDDQISRFTSFLSLSKNPHIGEYFDGNLEFLSTEKGFLMGSTPIMRESLISVESLI